MTRHAGDQQPVWVGLDLGTQGARALAVAGDGRVLGRGSQPLTGRRDGERHEQDPRRWWTALAAASRTALHGIARERIRGAATCATSGTIALVDRTGTPITPGLMYDDGRAGEHARLVNALDPPLRVGAGWGLPKLLWMLAEWPDLVCDGVMLVHQADMVTRRLVGHVVPTDSSHALKSGYDVAAAAWPHALLDAVGVPPSLLPEVVAPGTVLGEISTRAAAETAIPAGTPVVAGMTDGCAAQLAAGAVAIGDWNSVLGTTLVLKGVSAQPVPDPAGVLYCHRAPGGGWLPGGASSSGAGVLAQQFPGRDLDDLGGRATQHARTSVLAYPLVSRGERFPFTAPAAEAFMLGTPQSDAEHFAALAQGLAFVERLCFDYVALLGAPLHGVLSFTGGATRNRDWCRLRADVLGRPVRLVEQAESAFGMAVLAAAMGRDVVAAAADMVRVSADLEPRMESAVHLRAQYRRLVAELEARGWLGARLAAQARHAAA